MSGNGVVFSVEGNKVVPVLLDYSALPRANPKRTSARVRVYTGLALYQGRAGVYLVAREWKRGATSAPIGAIVSFSYSTGSWGNVYHSYTAFFVVAETGENTFTLHDTVRGHDAEVRVKNLALLPVLSEEDRAQAEAEILNNGWRPSEYDPVRSLYCYWMRDKVHERAVPQQRVHAATATTSEEVEPEEVEKIFEEPEELPSVSAATPAPVPAPAVVALPAGSAEAAPPAEQPERAELVKVYLLSMRLPSRYLVQSVEYDASKTSVREVRFWAGEKARIASRLESIRRMALAKISRVFAFVEEYGVWVAVTEQALEEARKVSQFVVDELKKLNLDHFAERYIVRAVPVYLEPADAKELLAAAVKHLSADAETLKQKIKDAEKEQEKREIRRLRAELDRVNALLSQFLSEMRRRGW
jgi:hypothetical protein